MFKDRAEAGEMLAEKLDRYRSSDAIILAIPRGGVGVAFYTARELKLPLDVIICRKLPFPYNPEAGFGSVAEDGSLYIVPGTGRYIQEMTIEQIRRQQIVEIGRLKAMLRHGRDLTPITDRQVILVDDGIAVGSTMRAAVLMCTNRKAARIVVASPVAGQDTAAEFEQVADEVVILEKPRFFRAVAQVYENWHDLTDKETMALLDKRDENSLIPG